MIEVSLEERSGFGTTVLVAHDEVSASVALAAQVARVVSGGNGGNGLVNLALATGNSMVRVYAELARLHRESGLSFGAVNGFLLDEYVGLCAGDERSFRSWLDRHLIRHVDFDPVRVYVPGVGAGGDEGAGFPDPTDYDAKIANAGGIDLALLGIGVNGHVAFNEPGSPPDSRTRVVELTASTRAAAADVFGSLDDVPLRAVTLGISNLRECGSLRLLALGRGKAEAVLRFLAGPVDPAIPASLLRDHPDLVVILDREAAALLPR